jgi:hypothetical protein
VEKRNWMIFGLSVAKGLVDDRGALLKTLKAGPDAPSPRKNARNLASG